MRFQFTLTPELQAMAAEVAEEYGISLVEAAERMWEAGWVIAEAEYYAHHPAESDS